MLMGTTPEAQARERAAEAIARLQSFDTSTLPREKDLGAYMSFAAAVEPAERLIRLYKLIPITVLEDYPQDRLEQLAKQANADYGYLKKVLDFQPGSPASERDSLVNTISTAYTAAFNALSPVVAYAACKSTDFQGLERQARATMATVEEMGRELAGKLASHEKEGKAALDTLQEALAEQGVSQHAAYFKEEANNHETQAEKWLTKVYYAAGILCAYAVASLFFHLIPWFKPEDKYQTVQFVVSKVLIFGVLSYMLYQATRIFMAHKHNAVVNRHRQNSLLTFKALVDAAQAPNKDVVLNHAAACIYSPQTTGYSSDGAEGPAAKSVVEVIGGAMSGGQSS